MELIHYSEEPVTLDRSRIYYQNDKRGTGKPDGLWISVTGEDDWKSWCEEQEFHLQGLTHSHRITLAPENNILYITDEAALNELHKKYSTEAHMTRTYLTSTEDEFKDEFEFKNQPINWELVSSKFDGIIIAPYMWSMRFCPFWYYGWDCASGCIWNLDAIKSMEAL